MDILPDNYKYFDKDEKRDWDYYQSCFENVLANYKVIPTQHPVLNSFTSFESKEIPFIHQAWIVSKNNFRFKLCLITYQISWQTAPSRFSAGTICKATHPYFFGYLDLKDDYGRALIRHETLADIVAEVFEPMEIDFPENAKFNWKYFVLANEKEQFLKNFNGNVLDFLSEIYPPEIEFNHHQCLFRLPKAIDMKETMELCEIGIKLDETLNYKTI
jgi:hypothetical protein